MCQIAAAVFRYHYHCLLYTSVLEIDLDRHKGKAFFLQFGFHLVDLTAVKEKFTDTKGIFIENIAFFVGTDVPVSYTHLDVYKRQAQISAYSAIFPPVAAA